MKWYSLLDKHPEIGVCKTCRLKIEVESIRSKYQGECPRCKRKPEGFRTKEEKESMDRLGGM